MTRHTIRHAELVPAVLGTGRRRSDHDLHDVVAIGKSSALETWLASTPGSQDRADQLADLSDAQIRTLVGLLDPTTARDLLTSLDPHDSREMLHVVHPAVAAGLVDSLEAVELLRTLADPERATVLAAMRVSRSAVVRGCSPGRRTVPPPA